MAWALTSAVSCTTTTLQRANSLVRLRALRLGFCSASVASFQLPQLGVLDKVVVAGKAGNDEALHSISETLFEPVGFCKGGEGRAYQLSPTRPFPPFPKIFGR